MSKEVTLSSITVKSVNEFIDTCYKVRNGNKPDVIIEGALARDIGKSMNVSFGAHHQERRLPMVGGAGLIIAAANGPMAILGAAVAGLDMFGRSSIASSQAEAMPFGGRCMWLTKLGYKIVYNDGAKVVLSASQ